MAERLGTQTISYNTYFSTLALKNVIEWKKQCTQLKYEKQIN